MQVGRTSEVRTAQGMMSAVKRETSGQKAAAARKERYDTVAISEEAQGAQHSGGAEQSFASARELGEYLRQNFPAYRKGMVTISGSFIRDCVKDPAKLAELEENLKAVPDILEKVKKNLPKNTRLICCTFSIDKEGNMSMEKGTTTVIFNAAKRSAELSGARSANDVRAVLTKLRKDLSDVKAGGCDEDTIALVKKMIRKAQKKLRRLKRDGETVGTVADVEMPTASPAQTAAPFVPAQTSVQ